MKKLLALAVAMAFLPISGCSDSVQTSTDGQTVISMLFSESGSAPFKSDWLVLREIEKRANVKLNIQTVPDSDYQTKRGVVFASGNIPDILTNTWAGEISQYASTGIMLPVSDHLDKLPNLKKVIDEWELSDVIDDISEMDGKFYVLPALRKELGGNQVFAYRKDIFDELGIAPPETYDELHTALLAVKAAHPESLGFGDPFKGDMMMSFIAEGFDTNGGWSLPYGYSYKFETDEWYFAPSSDEYKALATYLNKLYVDGVLDPEAFTQDGNQHKQKILNTKYAVTPVDGNRGAREIEGNFVKLGNDKAKMVPLYPLAGPNGTRSVKPTSRYSGGNAMPMSVSKRNDFDKVLEFCDWLYYSEEAAILTTIGAENETYTIVDGKYKMNSDIMAAGNSNGTVDMWKDHGIGMMGLTNLVPDIRPEEIRTLNANPDDYAFDKYIKDNNMTTQDDPLVKMTTEQRERTKLLSTTLKEYSNQMFMKFIYGQEPLSNWDAYVANCKAKGSDELIEIVTKAWQEN